MNDRMKYLLDKLDAYGLDKSSYVIFGSGPLGIRGIRESNDIDLIVTKDLFDSLFAKYGQSSIKHLDDGRIGIILSDEIEIFPDWHGSLRDKALEILNDPEIIDGYPFAKLKYLKIWKNELARPKDLNDLRMLDEYLEKNGDKEE